MASEALCLSREDSEFLRYLRGIAIFIIVFGHVGGSWIFSPYSEFFTTVFVPVFFFISGAVSFYSFQRSKSLKIYYQKRIVGLLTPYYLLCILSLIIYLILNKKFPAFSIDKLLLWLSIRPNNAIMPFPVDQVWFLHTLLIISIFSPIYFKLYRSNSQILIIIIILSFFISGIQHIHHIHHYLYLAGNNFYKPIVHSLFYILGFVYFSSSKFRNKALLTSIAIVSIAICFFLVFLFNLNINYELHTFSPDMYYVVGSLAAIATFLIFQYEIVNICNKIVIKKILNFFHRHTFSIFLLHSFGIYLSETIFGLGTPQNKNIQYGIIKLTIVLIITCILAIPYSFISVFLSKRAIK